MPPKKRINRVDIINSALKLIRKGKSSFSARSIAMDMKMSVVPIYSEFGNMKELETELLKTVLEMLFSDKYQGSTPFLFLNIGVGYITFAVEEKELFNWLFNRGGTEDNRAVAVLTPIIDRTYHMVREQEKFKECSDSQVKELVDNLWIFSHGLATLMNTGVVEKMTDGELVQKLAIAFEGFDPRNKKE